MHCTDRQLLKNIYTKVTRIWPLLILSKSEVKVSYLKKIISEQPQEVNLQSQHHCTDRQLSKSIYTKVTRIWPLLSVQTGSQSFIFKQIISQHPQEVNLQYLHHCTDCQLSKNIYTNVTPIWPLLPVQTGRQSVILTKSYLNNHKR